MAKEIINVSNPNDGLGDTLRQAGIKINNNFNELYDYASFTSEYLNFDVDPLITDIDPDLKVTEVSGLDNGIKSLSLADPTSSYPYVMKTIINLYENDITITPSNFVNGTTITLNTNGVIDLIYINSNWMIKSNTLWNVT